MSIIAGLVMGLAAPATPAATTAAEVLAAHRAATSIGPDGCRARGADDAIASDEIVVCGRRTDPYALPFYDPTDDDDASRYGGNRVGQMAAIAETQSPCARHSNACLPPIAVDVFAIAPVLIKGVARGVEALTDGE